MVFYCGSKSHKSSSFTLSAGGSKTLSWPFEGLTPGTNYYIYGELYNSNDDPLLTTDNSQMYYTTASQRPDDWLWPSTVASGYATSNITANIWLSGFIPRIQEFAVYCGVELNSTQLSNAKNGVASGSPMTATQMNGARYLITQLDIKTQVPNTVASGSTATAQFILDLTDALNSIP